MPGPLAGIRILDFTSVLMGPSATQMLAEMGATVIKVEAPEGDTTRRIGPTRHPGMGSNFLNMNRGKRSVALNLKHPRSTEILKRMVSRCDVLIHNIRPKAAAKLGLTEAELRPHNKQLIYCVLTGFGSAGPYFGQPAYDDLIQGLAAIPSLYERSGEKPRYVPAPIADRVAGLNAVVAITAALVHRGHTGVGQAVEVPMFESIAHMVLSDHMYGRTHEPPLGSAGYDRILSPSRHPYRTSDGWLCVLMYQDHHWQAFFKLVGREDLAVDSRYTTMQARNKHIDELYSWVAQTLLTRRSEEWLQALRAADIPVSPMHSLESLLEDEHLIKAGFFGHMKHPTEGHVKTLRLPMTWSSSTPSTPLPAPNLGEHSAEILRELGLDDTTINALFAEGVVSKPSRPVGAT